MTQWTTRPTESGMYAYKIPSIGIFDYQYVSIENGRLGFDYKDEWLVRILRECERNNEPVLWCRFEVPPSPNLEDINDTN